MKKREKGVLAIYDVLSDLQSLRTATFALLQN